MISLSLSLVLLWASPSQAQELLSFGVDHFGDDGDEPDRCCPGCSDLWFSVGMARVVFEELAGVMVSEHLYTDLSVNSRDFIDRDKEDFGRDYVAGVGVDSADVGYLSSHGGRRCNDSSGMYFSGWTMGHVNEDTNVCTPNTHDHILLGNPGGLYGGDMEVMIVDTCHSASHCAWVGGGYEDMAGSELNALLGWHGVSYDTLSQKGRLRDYVQNSKTAAQGGLGDHWISYRTKRPWGADNDHCASVVIWGDTPEERDDLFYNGALANHQWYSREAAAESERYFACDCAPRGDVEVSFNCLMGY